MIRTHVIDARGAGREESILKKTKKGWVVLSPRTHKKLGGPYKTKKEAVRRLRQIERFKRVKKRARASALTWVSPIGARIA